MHRIQSVLGFIAVVIFISATVGEARRTQWFELEGYTFSRYVSEFNKVYATPQEAELREKIFAKNLAEIKAHNAREDKTYKKGVNHMTDWTEKEFKKLLGYKRSANHRTLRSGAKMHQLTGKSVPPSVDWRTMGAISAIKDQGQCGSCWAFSSSQTVESFWFLKTGNMMDLSPQQIASCTEIPPQCFNQGTGGCEGSSQVVAFTAIINNGGIVSEWTYPYQSWNGTDYQCQFSGNKTIGAVVKLQNFTVIEPNSYEALMDAVANIGPVTISVDASTWSSYESGVYDGCNQTNPTIDHAVQLVGYGADDRGVPYWIVRNSWTPKWGENGYIRLLRDVPARCGYDPGAADCDGAPTTPTVCGTCGILYDNAYPIIA